MRINRRTFLQAIVVTAAPLAACRGDDASDLDDRREAGAPEGGTEGGEAGPPPQDGQRFFPQSVASGDPRPEGMILWTHVVDDTLPPADRELTLEVATDPAFS